MKAPSAIFLLFHLNRLDVPALLLFPLLQPWESCLKMWSVQVPWQIHIFSLVRAVVEQVRSYPRILFFFPTKCFCVDLCQTI